MSETIKTENINKDIIYEEIEQLAAHYQPWMVKLRRDFHKFPETGWLEVRTSAVIAKELAEMGYEVVTGRAVCREESRMAVPEPEIREEHFRKVSQQAEQEDYGSYLTEDMREGFTGVVGILHFRDAKTQKEAKKDVKDGGIAEEKPPVIALRFDIDALPITESEEDGHRPYREGFSSRYPGMMHACGHDCHAAIGLGAARILADLKKKLEKYESTSLALKGTVKLLFQPAEEGTRGAAAMVAAGHLDGVDYFAGTHVAPEDGEDDGDMTPGSCGSLATSKYHVYFHGKSAHAGGVPEQGRNAVLAAAHAVVGLAGISRHSGGMSRVNVGLIQGGSASNVVADACMFAMEVRGETTEINDYMAKRAREVCEAAAMMEGCTCEMELRGQAPSQISSPELAGRIAEMMEMHYPEIRVSSNRNPRNPGSEDIGFMMERVQKQGGQAVYMRSVTKMASPQHTIRFDVDERVLRTGAVTFAAIVCDLMNIERRRTIR